MEREPINLADRTPLTRISVTGGAGRFVVRNGDQAPVVVWVTANGLSCECGAPRCSHIASLVMCGFVEPSGPQSKAA